MKRIRLLRLIAADASADQADKLIKHLRDAGHAVRPAYVRDREGLERVLAEHIWDMALLCERLEQAREILELLSARDVPIIVISDSPEPAVRHECLDFLRCGAKDVVHREHGSHLQQVAERELDQLERNRLLRRLRLELHESEKRYRTLVGTSRDAIACVHKGHHVYANDAYVRLFGFESLEVLLGRPLSELVTRDDRKDFDEFMRNLSEGEEAEAQIELKGIARGGEEAVMQMHVSPVRFERKACLQVAVWSERQDEREPRRSPGMHDPVTGAHERTSFEAFMLKAMGRAESEQRQSALFVLQLDNLEGMKDTMGVAGVNRVVLELAALLEEKLPDDAALGRLSDGDFGVLLEAGNTADIERLKRTLRRNLANCVLEFRNRSVPVSTRLGVVPIPPGERDCARVIRLAQESAQTAERSEHPDPPDPGELRSLLRHVEEAISEGRVSLTFQPIVRLSGELMELYEVFTRFKDRDGRPIHAEELFRTAPDEPGPFARLDAWVLEQTIQLLGRRYEEGHDTHLFVKLSSESVRNIDTALTIGKLLKTYKVPQGRLIIEISETSAVGEVKYAKAFIRALSNFRCPTALEHFGTGLTSFRLLEHLPVDYLKIDASLIMNLSGDEHSQRIVRSIAGEAQRRGELTIAECLEDPRSLALLFDYGVDFAQGYCIQEPSELLEFDFRSQSG